MPYRFRRLVFAASQVLLALAAACGGAATTAAPTVEPTQAAPPTPTLAPAQAPTPTPPAAAPTLEPTATEQSLFAPVTDEDWQVGPKSAVVTIVEYGCFQ